MIENFLPGKILFLDIETVPEKHDYELLPVHLQEMWAKKTLFQRKDNETPDVFYQKAGIYAEFGKIVCISTGFFKNFGDERQFRLKSFAGDDEKRILFDFSEMLNKYYNRKDHTLCAHNGKEFDFPFIARRIIINGLKVPPILNVSGKKPWETSFLDTMECWKFGDYKNYVSLDLLATILNVPTPKDDITGSDVSRVYWQERDLQRITTYCMKDVITIAQIFLRFRGEKLLQPHEIVV